MTIKYRFVTGEEIYVEVYGRFEKIMTKLNCVPKSEKSGDVVKEVINLSCLNREDIVDSEANPELMLLIRDSKKS